MPQIEEAQPKYLQIAHYIRDQILRGDLRPGDEVPSERQLAADWKVSRPTAARSLEALSHQGLVEKRRIAEVVAQLARQRRDRLGPPVRHQFRTVKNRLGRTLENQLMGFHSDAPGDHENRMISALPIRFSAGTRPTPFSFTP